MTDNIIDNYFNNHIETINNLKDQKDKILSIANTIHNCFNNGGKLYICGNGGSASDAQHIAAELVGKYLKDKDALPAVSLSTDTSILTAISNDYGYDQIFKRQIDALATEKDIIMVISTSGNSKNIINAIKAAKEKKSMTIGLLGETNGKAKDIVDISISVPSNFTPHIQEAHIMIGHIICQIIEESIC